MLLLCNYENDRFHNKGSEAVQRLHFFHGQSLVISMILKNSFMLSFGIPTALILEIYDFGIYILQCDVITAPSQVRNIYCSLVRGGSVIVSSCLTLGYNTIHRGLVDLLNVFRKVFGSLQIPISEKETRNANSRNTINTNVATQESYFSKQQKSKVIFEIMTVEALLGCILCLLQFCSESLALEENCLSVVIDGLELAFHAIKSKYQPHFRQHHRFRSLHIILLECFTLLPSGSFPNSLQQIYIESLRVFRDSMSSDYGCSDLTTLYPKDLYKLSNAIRILKGG